MSEWASPISRGIIVSHALHIVLSPCSAFIFHCEGYSHIFLASDGVQIMNMLGRILLKEKKRNVKDSDNINGYNQSRHCYQPSQHRENVAVHSSFIKCITIYVLFPSYLLEEGRCFARQKRILMVS